MEKGILRKAKQLFIFEEVNRMRKVLMRKGLAVKLARMAQKIRHPSCHEARWRYRYVALPGQRAACLRWGAAQL